MNRKQRKQELKQKKQAQKARKAEKKVTKSGTIYESNTTQKASTANANAEAESIKTNTTNSADTATKANTNTADTATKANTNTADTGTKANTNTADTGTKSNTSSASNATSNAGTASAVVPPLLIPSMGSVAARVAEEKGKEEYEKGDPIQVSNREDWGNRSAEKYINPNFKSRRKTDNPEPAKPTTKKGFVPSDTLTYGTEKPDTNSTPKVETPTQQVAKQPKKRVSRSGVLYSDAVVGSDEYNSIKSSKDFSSSYRDYADRKDLSDQQKEQRAVADIMAYYKQKDVKK